MKRLTIQYIRIKIIYLTFQLNGQYNDNKKNMEGSLRKKQGVRKLDINFQGEEVYSSSKFIKLETVEISLGTQLRGCSQIT